jgi:hypothetical protein
VNNRKTLKIEGALKTEALRILREIPGIAVVPKAAAPRREIDAFVKFAGHRTPVAVEFKRRANAATAWQLVHQAEARPDTPLLLIAGQTTVKVREILEQHEIAFVDGLGNAHIELPGLLFHLEGRRGPRKGEVTPTPTRLRGKAGIVAQALLFAPERAWQVGELADEAQVSGALAHRVLTRLEGEKIVAAEGAGPKRVRRLTNPTAPRPRRGERRLTDADAGISSHRRPASSFRRSVAPRPEPHRLRAHRCCRRKPRRSLHHGGFCRRGVGAAAAPSNCAMPRAQAA